MRLYFQCGDSDVVGPSGACRSSASKESNRQPPQRSKSHAANHAQLALADRQEAQSSQTEDMKNDMHDNDKMEQKRN